MPLIIPRAIPAFKLLEKSVFLMDEQRALHQDIRPLRVLIFNLMPTKIQTENQLFSLLGNTALQIEITLLKTKTYESKNTDKRHLDRFYVEFDALKDKNFDAAIVTGAPVEHLAFEKVDYWEEFTHIMTYLRAHCTSTMYLCWGAMAALYYFHHISKTAFENKLFGVFEHNIKSDNILLSGLDERVKLPHSRHSGVNENQIRAKKELEILLEGEQSGITMLKDAKDIFILAHPEYSKFTLDEEYKRDIQRGQKRDKPLFYYDEKGQALLSWRSNASVIFANWLNFVYQHTPYKH